jgi:hypothetical protein
MRICCYTFYALFFCCKVSTKGVRQFAYSLEAGRLGSQEAGRDEAYEHSSIQAFQPSSLPAILLIPETSRAASRPRG